MIGVPAICRPAGRRVAGPGECPGLRQHPARRRSRSRDRRSGRRRPRRRHRCRFGCGPWRRYRRRQCPERLSICAAAVQRLLFAVHGGPDTSATALLPAGTGLRTRRPRLCATPIQRRHRLEPAGIQSADQWSAISTAVFCVPALISAAIPCLPAALLRAVSIQPAKPVPGPGRQRAVGACLGWWQSETNSGPRPAKTAYPIDRCTVNRPGGWLTPAHRAAPWRLSGRRCRSLR